MFNCIDADIIRFDGTAESMKRIKDLAGIDDCEILLNPETHETELRVCKDYVRIGDFVVYKNHHMMGIGLRENLLDDYMNLDDSDEREEKIIMGTKIACIYSIEFDGSKESASKIKKVVGDVSEFCYASKYCSDNPNEPESVQLKIANCVAEPGDFILYTDQGFFGVHNCKVHDNIDFEFQKEYFQLHNGLSLASTSVLMECDDYKVRFIAEYIQLKIRYTKLKEMCEKWDNHSLSFTPTCPRSTYMLQLDAMEKYLAVLEARAVMENITIY